MKQILSFIGPPGSGKGTQAELLAQEFHFVHIATGDLFRNLRSHADSDQFAKEVIERYDKGIPQPDDVATKLVFRELEVLGDAQGVILDPYPLSLGQAEILEKFVQEHASAYAKPYLVFIAISEDEAVKRLLLRKQKAGRTDDTEDIVRFRYTEYDKRAQDLVKLYTKLGRFIHIHGEQSIEDVYTELKETLLARELIHP